MRLLRLLLLLAVFGLFGCSKPKPAVETPGEFTASYAEALRGKAPAMKVVVVQDLELKITPAGGEEFSAFLDNAYVTYKQAPEAKAEVIEKFMQGTLSMSEARRDKTVDRSAIVPIIKDRPWLEETRQALRGRGSEKVPEQVFEDFNSELVILYAEDSPNSIRYLTPADLQEIGVRREELRKLSKENLYRILPKVERRGGNGLYLVSAGGDYDASLLLLEPIWEDGQLKVLGDIVVAIPTRDLLLVTGSKDARGIEKVKEIVETATAEGAYRLTKKLFVYRGGKFEEFVAE